MKDPLKPRDKITQKMTRDGAIAENQTTGDTERIATAYGTRIYKRPRNNRRHRTLCSFPRYLIQARFPMCRELPPKRTQAKRSAS